MQEINSKQSPIFNKNNNIVARKGGYPKTWQRKTIKTKDDHSDISWQDKEISWFINNHAGV